ncbi:MAG: DUF6159 family protein [Pseudomonadota bacterium]
MAFFDRYRRGFLLVKQSWHVLNQDKRLLAFPILSAVCTFAVFLSFAVPIASSEKVQDFLSEQNYIVEAADFAILFLFYFLIFFVITVFNAALISCAITSLRGGKPTLIGGMKAALTRLPQILAWSLLSATVGVLLRVIESRFPLVMRLFAMFAGFLWAVASYFAVPVMVAEGLGPLGAVKRSVTIIRKTWGEALVINLGLNALFALMLFIVGLPFFVIGPLGDNRLVLAYLACVVVFFILVALIGTTLTTIARSAIYCYAVDGKAPSGFDAQWLSTAFRQR